MHIKFVTGFSGFGGSTIALLEHCKLLSRHGYSVELYGESDWHLGRFEGSRLISELRISHEDFLIYHALELSERPDCRGCYLYLHEKELFDLKSRIVSGYDGFIFLNKSQREFHGAPGFIVPNPMDSLVDPFLHSPPGRNIAGVVGTIQSRKMQHLSIAKALEDGVEKVLVFGDKDDCYFSSYVEPMLSDKVIYMGFYETSRRMEMYNQFDVLYNFSSDESACLAVGECGILGKKVVKDEAVAEYDFMSSEEIAKRWGDLFMVNGGKLACVVTYDRKDVVGKWLRAWNNADKFGTRLAVLHACDGDVPDEEQKENILKYSPDFYIPFKNTELRDMQALMLVVNNQVDLPNWDFLFWFTDDLLPMRKTFLRPFVEKIQKPGVGLVAQCYEPKSIAGADAHIRTVAYAMTRDVAKKIRFPEVGPMIKRPYLFESGEKGVFEDHILKQVLDMGLEFELCHSKLGDSYQHWTSFLDWMWDCHLLGHWSEYWNIYERQFNSEPRFDHLKTSRETLLTMEQCEELTLVPGRVCAIIPTSTAPMENLVWSVLSMLLRSDSQVLDHLVIGINGPDSRTGDPGLQDLKQKFVEELRSMKWRGRDMPVTLVRTWSRIGHAQTLEQCIPWAHTEFYLSMHDDVIVMDRGWGSVLGDFAKNEDLLCFTYGDPLSVLHSHEGGLRLPHFNSIFTLCKKSRMKSINANWVGYHVPLDFVIDNLWSYEDFMAWHKRKGLSCEGGACEINKEDLYSFVGMDIGSCFVPEVMNKGLRMERFPEDCLVHLGRMSWGAEDWKNSRTSEIRRYVKKLEEDIFIDGNFSEIYEKYVGKIKGRIL